MLQINVPRATPSNVKDREMFKRDEVAISLITSEAENVFSAQLHSIQIHLKRLKLTMRMYLKECWGNKFKGIIHGQLSFEVLPSPEDVRGTGLGVGAEFHFICFN